MLHPRAHIQSRITPSLQDGSRSEVCTPLTAFTGASHIRVSARQPLFSTPNSAVLVAAVVSMLCG